jgi:hypothetical protein
MLKNWAFPFAALRVGSTPSGASRRRPSGLGCSPRCRLSRAPSARDQAAIRSSSPSGPPNAAQRDSIQSITSSCANRHPQENVLWLFDFSITLSWCPRSHRFFLANQLSWGQPTRGCAPGSPSHRDGSRGPGGHFPRQNNFHITLLMTLQNPQPPSSPFPSSPQQGS